LKSRGRTAAQCLDDQPGYNFILVGNDDGAAVVATALGGKEVSLVNGRMPLYLTLILAALTVTAVFTFQPYSADFPGTAYAKPAQRYIRAALRQDSVGLTRLSASFSPVAWGLEAARKHPDSLAAWGSHPQAWTGERRGDTAEVFLYPDRDPCSQVPIVLRFLGSGKKARVLRASSACLDPR
jgi:hypothetical protein